MRHFISITPTIVTEGDKLEMASICKTLFPDHSFYMESNGTVRMTKGTWSNPESFEIHWMELFLVVIPTLTIKSMGSRKILVGDYFINTGVRPDKVSRYLGMVRQYCRL